MNREAWQALQRERDMNRKRRERHTAMAMATIVWLPEAVRLHPAKRVMVVGVCSNCEPQVAATYGVKV